MRYGSSIKAVLENIEGGLETSAALLEMFLRAYPNSYRSMRGMEKRYAFGNRRRKETEKPTEKQKDYFYQTMSRLKKQGLIQKKADKRGAVWRITGRGSKILAEFRNKLPYLSRSAKYESRKSDRLIIVIFDVPEKERRKRVWLRSVLQNLGFEMLQKSVWAGKKKIPEELLHDLRQRQMINYVQIFEINKTGTISQVM